MGKRQISYSRVINKAKFDRVVRNKRSVAGRMVNWTAFTPDVFDVRPLSAEGNNAVYLNGFVYFKVLNDTQPAEVSSCACCGGVVPLRPDMYSYYCEKVKPKVVFETDNSYHDYTKRSRPQFNELMEDSRKLMNKMIDILRYR